MSKKRKYGTIEIDVGGKRYQGERVIEGTITLDQYVIYNDKCVADLKGYSSSKMDTEMKVYAELILSELVSGRTLSAQPKSKYGL